MILKRAAIHSYLLFMFVMPSWGQNSVAITGARILTVTHGTIDNGSVLISNGKIVAVGQGLKIPPGTQVIEGKGKVVMPGIFDAGDQLGLVEIAFEPVTDDSTEYTDPVHPELRVLDALNPRSENIKVARTAGITNAVVMPAGGNLISGQSAVIQLDGDSTERIVVKSPVALHLNLGEESKRTYGNKDKSPKTRMGAMAMLRQAFLKAQHYKATLDASAAQKSAEAAFQPPERDLKMDALVAVLNREIPVVVHANRLSDIETAIRLADEFHLRLILLEAVSAWRLADQLALRGVPVIVGPILQAPSRIESVDARLDNAAILHKAGITVAIQSGSINGVRDLWFAVEYAIANGLPEDAALMAVTLNPAQLFGVQDRLGSIDVGKDATLLVLDGEPFRVRTQVVTVLIGGKIVDLSNHQTELYKTFKNKYGIK